MQSQTRPNLCYQTPTPRRQHRTLAKRQTSTSPPPQHHAEHPVAPVPARTRGHGPGRSPSPTSTASHQNLTPNPRPPHPRELLPSIAHQEGGFLFLATPLGRELFQTPRTRTVLLAERDAPIKITTLVKTEK